MAAAIHLPSSPGDCRITSRRIRSRGMSGEPARLRGTSPSRSFFRARSGRSGDMSHRLCLHPTVSARASAIVIRHAIKLMRRSSPATTRAPVGRRAGMCHGSGRAVPPCRAPQCANRPNSRQPRGRLAQTRACAMGRAGASVRRRSPRPSGESECPRTATYTTPSRLWLRCGGDAVGRNGIGDARALAPPGTVCCRRSR